MRQHHPARANADALGRQCHRANQHLGRAARKPRRGMMLCQPIAVIAQRITGLRKVYRVADGIGRRQPRFNGRLVKHGKAIGHGHMAQCSDVAGGEKPKLVIAARPA